MDRWHGIFRLAIAFTVVAASPVAAGAQTAIAAPVILKIGGLSILPPGAAERAQQVVTRIYSAASTRVAWRPAGETEPLPDDGFLISVIIRRQLQEEEVPRLILGFAPNPRGRVAYVLYDHVAAFAMANHLDLGQTIGHVIAHEVGHLLLPEKAHSRTGLMQENLNFQTLRRAPHGEIPFTPRQAAQIQARLTAAAQLAAAEVP